MKVLVITAAGLRPDYLGCYGCDWIDTPNLDQLAAAGVVFDNHHAVHPDSEGASQAWRTGKYFSDCRRVAEQLKGSASEPDLLAALDGVGVDTVLIADANRPTADSFTQGWKEVHRSDSIASFLETIDKALAQSTRKKNGLLWIDLPILLPPWQIPEDFLEAYFDSSKDEAGEEDEMDEDGEDQEEVEGDEEQDEEGDVEEEPLVPLLNPTCGVDESIEDEVIERLQNTYAAGVAYLDSIVGQVLELLADVDPEDEWLLIVTSPHGLALGEHGLVGSTPCSLHEEHIHVPLLMRLPGGVEAGRRISAPTQTIDFAPTLLEAFGIEREVRDGSSLLPLAIGKSEITRPYSLSRRDLGKKSQWSLRTLEWKFILSAAEIDSPDEPKHQLYAKPQDRWEVNNLIQHHHELADELERTLRTFIERARVV